MPQVELTSARAKAARAMEHIATLEAEKKKRLPGDGRSRKPLRIDRKLDKRGREWHVAIPQGDITIPAGWALIAGDALHNARTALDHIVYALSSRSTKRPSFPILPVQPKSAEDIANWQRATRGLSQKHLDLVVDFQPYTHPGLHRSANLKLLSALDNRDKHRVLLGGIYGTTQHTAGGATCPNGHPVTLRVHPRPFETDRELLRYRCDFECDLNLDAWGRFDLAFEKSEATIPRIKGIAEDVHDIIRAFEVV
jgi:hypothetical protein